MQKTQGFIVDSYHLYEIATDAYLKSKNGIKIHRQNDVLVSIVFSALALEAFINELLSLAKDAKQAGSTEDFLDGLIDSIDESSSARKSINDLFSLAQDAKQTNSTANFVDDLINSIDDFRSKKKSTREKFMLASEALGNGFKKGENPYQDFADLFRLRDCLVHLKPEDRLETDESGEIKYLGRALTERLRSKGIFQESTTLNSITLLVSTAKAALWACNTASVMVNAILDKIPQSDFTNDNEALNLYRNAFQPPT